MEKIKQKRSTYRSLTTKLISKIEETISEQDIKIEDLEAFLEELQLKNTQLKQLDEQILEEISDNAEIENDIIKSEEYSSAIIKARCKIKQSLDKIKIPVHESASISTSENVGNLTRRTEPLVKLPLLNIEKFNGDPCDFQRFFDQFESAIHNNPDLSNIEKFNYLKSYLTATAANSIEGFSLTNDNYTSAIETIRERFGNKSLVINSHLNKLLSINPIKRSNDLLALRNLHDLLKSQIRNLDALNLKIEHYSSLLSPIVLKLLPSDFVLDINRKFAGDEILCVSKILDYLSREIASREQTAVVISTSQNIINSPQFVTRSSPTNKQNKTVYSAAGLFNENKKFPKKPKCIHCSEEHYLSECNNFRRKSLSEKQNFIKQNAICRLCLNYGHIAKSCRKNITCQKCYSKLHNTLLCANDDVTPSNEGKKSNSLSNKTNKTDVLLQTLKIKLLNEDENKHMIVRALCDTGSSRSYITDRVIKLMKYKPIAEENMTHNLFGGLQERKTHRRYRIFIESNYNDYACNFEVYNEHKICTDIPSLKNGPWMNKARDLGICFTDFDTYTGSQRDSGDIDLLIGADVYGKLLTGKMRSLTRGLTAIETHLGWTLSGKTFSCNKNDSTQTVLNLHVTESNLSELWKLDVLGITDPSEKESKLEIEKATEEYFKKTIRINEEGRYEVSLPWVKGHPPLSDGRKIAERRLKTCIDSLKKSGNIESYESVFNEWLAEGIIEIVESSSDEKNEFFLPHRAVIKEGSTTRVRPVFDGSSKEKGSPSINECLMTGPNLVELIPSVINRFRLRKIGVTADIRKAFLQISLNEKDRPFLRFLWARSGDLNEKIIFQNNRVVFGLTTSPFLLGATLQYHLSTVPESLKDTSSKLSESFYVDNCVSSVDSEDQLTKFISESKEILNIAKFDLRGWEYNNALSTTKSEFELESKTVPVLGLKWQLQSDTLTVDLKDSPKDYKPITKRNILSEVHKIFDPIGYTCPVTLLPKIMLQQLWKLKLSWDSELPDQIVRKFERWKNQLGVFKSIAIPRCLSDVSVDSGELSLHVFCDASQVAYATCIFLRNENDFSTTCRLVQARCRVAPLKSTTIPRLELLACTIGTRLSQKVKEDLHLLNIKTFYWTDSSNALYWIKGSENWAPFVYNRVQEIRTYSDPRNWFLVPGSDNPADLPSRGCSAETLRKSQWWEGPQWLKNSPEFWPKTQINPDYEIINSEKKKTIQTLVDVSETRLEFLKNISSYLKMIKMIAWIFRFFRNVRKQKHERNFENFLTAKELDYSEFVLLKYAQRDLGSDSKLNYGNLSTFKDDMGIIRVKTRISLREDLYSFRYPILLCNNHIISCLVLHYHFEHHHAGVQTLMSLLREKFWILKCRKTVRYILNQCLTCKRYKIKPTETPCAPLPEERVKVASVYEITGLDLCGPLFLRDGTKVWIVLFTCAIFRHIHLELVTSLSTEIFILALRRFISRRGRPSIIISDNGKNLVKTSNALKEINWEKIVKFASIKRIEWKFNPPASPWWGGFFERLIGMLKSILRKVLARANVTYEELLTILCGAESTINARPLTYISEDDELSPLTPAMFVQDITETRVPDLEQISSSYLRKRLKYKIKLQEDLRKRFRAEYLGQLKTFTKNNKSNALKEGDIVLIGDDNVKRINWPLGKILQVFPGKDGNPRVAAVRCKGKTFIRPFKRLYNLEITNNVFSSRLGEKLSSVPAPGPLVTDDERSVPESSDPEPGPPAASVAESSTTRPSAAVSGPSRAPDNPSSTGDHPEQLPGSPVPVPTTESSSPPKLYSRYGRRIKSRLV